MYHLYCKLMDVLFYITACSMLLVSGVGYVFVRIRLKPKDDSDLDDYYYEFEEEHPGYARYLKWSRIMYTCAVIGALMLFLAIAV